MAKPSPQDIAAGVPNGANVIQRINAPGGGEWLLGDDGGVFAINGAPYLGSYTGLDARDRQGQRKITGIEATPHGGYRLISDDQGPGGPGYAFNPHSDVAPPGAPNELFKDPAFLAFMRASGTSIETIAADNARKQAAYTNALNNFTLPENQQAEQSRLKNIAGGYESRGLSRSTQRASDQNQASGYYQGQAAKAKQTVADQINTDSQTLASEIAGQQRKGAELGYDVGQSADYNNLVEGIRKKYPTQTSF